MMMFFRRLLLRRPLPQKSARKFSTKSDLDRGKDATYYVRSAAKLMYSGGAMYLCYYAWKPLPYTSQEQPKGPLTAEEELARIKLISDQIADKWKLDQLNAMVDYFEKKWKLLVGRKNDD